MSETSEKEALLLAEIDKLRDDLHTQADWADWANGEIDRLRCANKDALDHYADARAEIDRLRAAIERVRALHCDVDAGVQDPEPWYWCACCRDPQPCPTLRALDGDA